VATFASRLADWRWLLHEKGLDHLHSELVQFADGTLTAYTGTVGAVDMQNVAVISPIIVRTVQPSGELNVGISGANPPVSKAPPGNFRT
jgi:hypothetical protein